MAEPREPESLEPDEEERSQVLLQLEEWLERPMLVLSFLWLCLVLIELIWTTAGVFEVVGTMIWIVFVLEFLLRLSIAPRKGVFLRRNPIAIAALIAPAFRFLNALRVLRLVRGLRLMRGLRLVRIVGTANRSLRALRKSFERRGLGYVLIATTLVVLLGAGGMLTFESMSDVEGGFTGYADALWWTAMLVTTIGSGFWPETPEGRVLALLLSVYGLAVFGYITASLATFFIGQEAHAPDGEVAGAVELAALRREIALLRADLRGREVP